MEKQSSQSTLQMISGLLVTCAALFGCWWLSTSVWGLFMTLERSIATATIAACTTILVAAMSAILANYYTRRRELAQQLHQRKTAIYEEFVKFWLILALSDKIEVKKPTEPEIQEFFATFTQTLIIWGSDEVLGQWSSMRREWVELNETGKPTTNMLFDLERLFLAIRRDTGHRNKNLKKGDVLGLFINDVNKYI